MEWTKSGGMILEDYVANKSRPVNASIVAFREVYEKVGDYNEEMRAGSDGDWNFRALAHYQDWQFIDEYLYYYRRHSEQLSKRRWSEQTNNHEKARAEFLRTYELSDL